MLVFVAACFLTTFTLSVFSALLCNAKGIYRDFPENSFADLVRGSLVLEQHHQKFVQPLSIERLAHEVETKLLARGKNTSAMEKLIAIEQTVTERLGHGKVLLNPCQNWLLFLISTLKIDYLKSKNLMSAVLPEDILKNPNSVFCSQNSIVLQELLGIYGFDSRGLSLGGADNGHLALAVNLEGNWYYIDGDLKYQKQIQNQLIPVQELLHPDNKILRMKVFNENVALAKDLERGIRTGETYLHNSGKIAERGRNFFTITKLISSYIWIIFCLFLFVLLGTRSKNKL